MKIELNHIYNGDCLALFREMRDNSVDLIVTDPPYRITSRGGTGTMSGFMTETRSKNGKIFTHNDIDIAEYLPEFYRVLKNGTHCYIMCNNVNLPHFFEVIGKSPFHFTKLLVWDKQNKICGTHYMSQVEFIFFLRKGSDRPISDCGESDLLTFPNKKDKHADGGNIHDSQKPVDLMRALILNSTRPHQIVLDPFLGSGTTAIAAIREKRCYIGFEVDKKYFDTSEKRILEENQKKSLFDFAD